MAVGFSESQPPASADVIAGVEAKLGIELPDDHKRILQQRNGGWLETNFFPHGNASLRCLYSAGPNDDEYLPDLESELHAFYLPDIDLEYKLRTGFLPIGEDGLGNCVCLKVAGEDYGAVWFWVHDTAGNEDPFERLSDSFGDFFEALRPIEELDVG